VFEGDLNNQLRLWLFIGIYTLPLGCVFYGIVLKIVAKILLRVSLLFRRAILAEVVVSVLNWIFTLFLIFMSQLIHHQMFWLTLSGLAWIFIRAVVYSKMVRDSELGQIALPKILKLSAWVTLVSILSGIPASLLERIIPSQ
jgi:hypothetical protein